MDLIRRWHRRLTAAVAVAVLAVGAAPAVLAAISVSIQPVGGNSFPLTVNTTDTVLSVKQQIENLQAIPVEEQRLVYAGVQLVNANTLADYNVQNGARIHLVRLPSSRSTQVATIEPIPGWLQSYARRDPSDACLPGWFGSWAAWPHGSTGGWTCDRVIPSLG